MKMEDGRPKFEEVPSSEKELPADLVLLSMGFTGPEKGGLLEQLGVELTDRGNVANTKWRTNVDGVYTAGDMQHGQSLIVWAIAEGRSAAAAIDGVLWARPISPLRYKAFRIAQYGVQKPYQSSSFN